MSANRSKSEIILERVDLFKAIKKSRTKGMRYGDMLKHVREYQNKLNHWTFDFYYTLDRNLINVHMPHLKKDGVVKCQDGKYRCLGYVPARMFYKP